MKRYIRSDISPEKYYIRFGSIPEDFQSHIHRGDGVYDMPKGVSVWNCVEANGVQFPILPENTNEDGYADYFYLLMSNKPVYLVTGTETPDVGPVGEPLLDSDIRIVKDLTEDYNYLKKIHAGQID